MSTMRMIGSALLLVIASVSAQSIVSTSNITNLGSPSNGALAFAVTHDTDRVSLGTYDLVGLTTSAANLQPDDTITGPILLANESSQLNLTAQDVAVISCDRYGGLIQAIGVFDTATERNVTAVIFYSTDKNAPACTLDNVQTTYTQIYTMKSSDDATDMLAAVNKLEGSTAEAMIGLNSTLGAEASSHGSTQSSTQSNGQQDRNTWNHPPSTAVAMIILYSITGVITALFLIIIVTGAVRAHRHPERYGPRNIMGRARQSRARGLARAMLETLPIVRFGEREEEQRTKSTDVEAGDGQTTGTVELETMPRENPTTNREVDGQESDIAPAATPSLSEPENQGCSICTDDFELGQDQRVLPCKHRFHPACIDPWLLNVSGTCPLCRIDLRPQGSHDDDEVDADGNHAVPREGDEALAPPLDGGSRRASVRRSILIGLTGLGHHRPERMTREERIAALRNYSQRNQHLQTSEGRSEDEEVSRRRRLRNAFRVRTRRTGEEGDVGEGAAAAVPAQGTIADEATQSATTGETNVPRPS